MARTTPILVAVLALVCLQGVATPVVAPGGVLEGEATGHSPADRSLDGAGPPPLRNVTTAPARAPVNGTGIGLADIEASNLTRPTDRLSTRLSVADSRLESRLSRYAFERRFRQANTRSAKHRLLFNVTENVSDRVDVLQAEQRAAVDAYAAGRASATDLLLTLGSVDARADALRRTLARVEELRGPGRVDIRNRVRAVESRLAVLSGGPVQRRVGDVVAGDRAPFDLYVAATRDGVALSTIDGQDYVREVVHFDRVDPAANGSLSVNAVEDVVFTTYPSLPNSTGPIDRYGSDAFRVVYPYGNGTLIGWIDESTESIYYVTEIRYLDRFPGGTDVARTSAGDFVVTVNRAPPGGALKVSVTNETGAPLDAQVSVNETTVGWTGEDGELWTLGRHETYEVAVVYQGRRISLEVEAADER